jgi:hypothetical protein
MSNSPLVTYKKISPHKALRTAHISKIAIHHVAGVANAEGIGNNFQGSRVASSNYGIGNDGSVGMYVEENYRAVTSSNTANDNQAVTVEVSNSSAGGEWPVSDKALYKLIDLCVDICQRNGIGKLIYTGDATGTLTSHNMFAATACPGPYLQSKLPHIAEETNKRLLPKPSEPSDWAKDACAWTVETGLFQGDGAGDFNWQGDMTREMVAMVLKRFYDNFGC